MNIEIVDQIYRFLSAYNDSEDIKAAIVLWNRERTGIKHEAVAKQKELLSRSRWKLFNGTIEEIPKGYEWTKLANTIYVRSPSDRNQVQIEMADYIYQKENESNDPETIQTQEVDQKTDLSMHPTDKVCPLCGEVMAWEPICPGCKLGLQGFRGRYVCMADFDHTYYMLKEGIDLPNR